MAEEDNKEGNKEDDSKPLCFGTYISENDILCAKCRQGMKKECIKITKIRIYP